VPRAWRGRAAAGQAEIAAPSGTVGSSGAAAAAGMARKQQQQQQQRPRAGSDAPPNTKSLLLIRSEEWAARGPGTIALSSPSTRGWDQAIDQQRRPLESVQRMEIARFRSSRFATIEQARLFCISSTAAQPAR